MCYTGNLQRSQWSKFPTIITIVGLSMMISACETTKVKVTQVATTVGSAAVCGVAAKLAGRSDETAIAWAVACGIVGAAVANKLENNRKEYASDEAFYAGERKKLLKYKQTLDGEIGLARNQLAKDEANIKAWQKDYEASGSKRQELADASERLTLRSKRLKAELATAEDEAKYQKGLVAQMKDAQTEDYGTANDELLALNESVNELRELVTIHEEQTADLGAFL